MFEGRTDHPNNVVIEEEEGAGTVTSRDGKRKSEASY